MTSWFRVESCPAHGADEDPASAPLRVVSAADPTVLLEIVQPGVGMVIWAREPADTWLHEAVAPLLLSGAARGQPSDLARRLSSSYSGGFPTWFERDLCWLAGLLSALAAAEELDARLGAPPVAGPPIGLRLSCRYGGMPSRWFHPSTGSDPAPGGLIDPFAVVLLKGAYRPSLRRRALSVEFDAVNDACPVLSIEPAIAA